MRLQTVIINCLSCLLIVQPALAQPGKETNALQVITSLSVNGNSVDIGDDSLLRKYLKIELISEDDFIFKQKTAVSYLTADTAKIKKKKGVLKLPVATGIKTFTDKLQDDESRQEYEYLGQISFLNVYLVRGLYWEELDYTFISKKNGAEIVSFSDMPYISPDKKKIISIYADPYETDTGVELYSIVNGKPKNILGVRFKNWMPSSEGMTMFWSNDGKLYVPIQYSNQYWNEDGNYNNNYQYIRISILL